MNAKRDTSETPRAERDANGRFVKGNAGGPGNPFARKVAALRKALVDSVTADDIRALFTMLLKRAKTGDTAAAKLLFQYALGKPGAAADPDRVDIDEWRLMQEKSRPPQEMAGVVGGMPAELATRMSKIVWPCAIEENFERPMRDGIDALDRRDAARKKHGAEAELPEALLDRLAMHGLNDEMPSILGEPTANGKNGSSTGRGKRGRHGL
jgi:hypothetical protein